jgi:hypothetical protein
VVPGIFGDCRIGRGGLAFALAACDTTHEKLIGIRLRYQEADHPKTDQDTIEVRSNNLAESSLDILVQFFLQVEDYGTARGAREAMLLRGCRIRVSDANASRRCIAVTGKSHGRATANVAPSRSNITEARS